MGRIGGAGEELVERLRGRGRAEAQDAIRGEGGGAGIAEEGVVRVEDVGAVVATGAEAAERIGEEGSAEGEGQGGDWLGGEAAALRAGDHQGPFAAIQGLDRCLERVGAGRDGGDLGKRTGLRGGGGSGGGRRGDSMRGSSKGTLRWTGPGEGAHRRLDALGRGLTEHLGRRVRGTRRGGGRARDAR